MSTGVRGFDLKSPFILPEEDPSLEAAAELAEGSGTGSAAAGGESLSEAGAALRAAPPGLDKQIPILPLLNLPPVRVFSLPFLLYSVSSSVALRQQSVVTAAVLSHLLLYSSLHNLPGFFSNSDTTSFLTFENVFLVEGALFFKAKS
ncbi:hypothetical protein SLEP1_g25872 [Rubroshorea leprosula]|uniref:Uncharacterized protein n=1 Tax=Rubroshorea leprosula TaxID=152421 RepID=A0AAV5JXT0_9ROSI|nr:hypothetical protein SLEP1_g25872 [Rubroshorea leprosula]